ncbi:hypothetical protein NQ318_004522 [Aromia moschata]|uniref:Uncharacterized protein n=1 Tax=Aromia moschata TaxID=1265417 RepID=A0AAV8Y5N2_9CUCU|nr:hypothetical protein NQ318_004522 [Aromia moschata]
MEVGVDALDFVILEQTYPPFVDDLPDISTPGSCISIQGAVKPDCTRCNTAHLIYNVAAAQIIAPIIGNVTLLPGACLSNITNGLTDNMSRSR